MNRTLLLIWVALALAVSGCVTTGTTPTGEGGAQGPALGDFMGNILGKLKGKGREGEGAASARNGGAGSLEAMVAQEENELVQRFASVEGVSVQRLEEAVAIAFMSDSFFDVDASALKPDTTRDLEYLADLLRRFPETRVEIGCYTDSSGSEQHNLSLSQQRAQAVGEFLAGKGVNPSRIESRGYGETNFVASNATENGRKLNRRLTLIIIPIGVQSLRNPPAREIAAQTLSPDGRDGFALPGNRLRS